MGTGIAGLFVSINNTVYVLESNLNQVQVWLEGSATPSRTFSGGLNSSTTIFVTIDGNLYVDNGRYNGRVDMWTANSTISTVVMYVDGACYGIFVDIYENIYCSVGDYHRVWKKLYKDSANTSIIVAGNGIAGSASNMLQDPRGIFVDLKLNLYVADCHNNRIQFFAPGQTNATTLMGTGAPGTMDIICPNNLVLDADGHLYVVDYIHNRIIGWGPNGYQCIAACNGSAGSSADHMNGPFALYFDSYGNIFVTDTVNNRVQKFLIINNTLGECHSLER